MSANIRRPSSTTRRATLETRGTRHAFAFAGRVLWNNPAQTLETLQQAFFARSDPVVAERIEAPFGFLSTQIPGRRTYRLAGAVALLALFVFAVAAVSYTHLTLPTNGW